MKTQKRRQTLRANYGHLVIGGHWSDVWSPGHVIAPHSSSYSRKLESLFVNILFVSQHSSVCDEERVTINDNLSDKEFCLKELGILSRRITILLQGDFFNWASPENVSGLAPPKFA